MIPAHTRLALCPLNYPHHSVPTYAEIKTCENVAGFLYTNNHTYLFPSLAEECLYLPELLVDDVYPFFSFFGCFNCSMSLHQKSLPTIKLDQAVTFLKWITTSFSSLLFSHATFITLYCCPFWSPESHSFTISHVGLQARFYSLSYKDKQPFDCQPFPCSKELLFQILPKVLLICWVMTWVFPPPLTFIETYCISSMDRQKFMFSHRPNHLFIVNKDTNSLSLAGTGDNSCLALPTSL